MTQCDRRFVLRRHGRGEKCLIAKSGPPTAAYSRQDAFAWTTSSSERQNNRSDKASTHTR